MGGVTVNEGVTACIIAFEPRQNVSHKNNDVSYNPSLSDSTHSYVPFLFEESFY